MQVWTVGEGFGIGSELRQTSFAANNFRDHDLNLVKAIWVHRAHRLLSESTRILCTFRNRPYTQSSAKLREALRPNENRMLNALLANAFGV